jgi:hypothetical protein
MPEPQDQTDTPKPETTPTPATTPTPDAGNEGTTDAPKPAEEAPAGDDDTSLLGGAEADSGVGNRDEAGGEGKGDGEAADEPAGPPETYDLKIELPGEDGADPVQVELDAALVEAAVPVFKEVGLTNEQANKIAPLAVKVQERMLQQQADDHSAMKAQWARDAKADPEIGGAKFEETLALAGRALDQFGAQSVKDADGKETNEFRSLLNESGLGNHPVMLRIFRNVGLKVGEDDALIRTDTSRQPKKPAEEVLYPNEAKK